MPFTAQELEEIRLADEEIEREFCQTQEEIEASRRRDRRAKFETLPIEKRKAAASKRAYREANREKVAASQKAWYEANREKVAASQKWIADARKKAGWTQADVARMIGVSQPSVALLEIGRMNLEKFSKRAELEELLK